MTFQASAHVVQASKLPRESSFGLEKYGQQRQAFLTILHFKWSFSLKKKKIGKHALPVTNWKLRPTAWRWLCTQSHQKSLKLPVEILLFKPFAREKISPTPLLFLSPPPTPPGNVGVLMCSNEPLTSSRHLQLL